MSLSLDGTTGISASGNITGGNVIASGSLVVGSFAPASVSTAGNVTGGNILTSGLISATGNVTGAYLFGNASAVTGLSASKIFNGTSEANIGTSGGNANISIAGVSNVFVVASTGIFTTGLSSVTGNITGGNISATNHTGTTVSVTGVITGASVVGGVITGSSLSVSGNITGGNVLGGANVNATTHTGTTVSVTGAITAGGDLSLVGNIVDTGPLTIITSSNGNIDLSPNGTGNVNTGANLSVTGRVTAASVVGGVMTGTSVSVSGAVTAASTVGGVITGTSASVSGTVTAASTVGGVLSGSSLTVSTGSITCGSIVNANANAVGNIGSSTTYFNTVFAKATSAQYADLAEMYQADAHYNPGTVVEFGGNNEITQSSSSHSTRVAGIISTNPSYLMNATMEGAHVLAVALVGRVPCRVVGHIAKGDRLVASDHPGVATVLDMTQYQPACIIGKALEEYNSDTVGIIEVAVGRF